MFSAIKFASLVVLAAAVGVQAQAGTSSAAASIPSGISSCALNCIETAASSAGCSSFTDLTCVCTNQQFQSAATTCLQGCGTADLQAAQALQSSECASISSAASGSSTVSSSASPAASTGSSSVISVTVPAGSTVSVVSGASTASSSVSHSVSGSASSGVSGSASGSAPGAAGSTSGSSSGSGKEFALNFNGIVGAGVAVVAAIAGAGLLL
ncbi:hypothetical protein BC835DRAFT_1385395 [Cytidiella melzeri]|nr:hypothetical protein BC835DRAFT_1385395 [Cytidiella melzeri]